MTMPKIGFIGLGIMGTPMSKNLLKAGYTLTLYDINRKNTEEIARLFPNAIIGKSPCDVALVSDIVITMLPSGRPVQQVTLGENGLVSGFRPGAMLLDTSSSEPSMTIETAAALNKIGIDMVDAPVSGAQWGAEAAELVFMVGGKEEAVLKVSPLLNIMGKKVFHLGPVGSGHTMKSINNLITAITFLATTEGLIIGKKSGLDPDVMIDVLNLSTGMSWISQTQIKQRILNRKFDDPFKLALMFKDINIAVDKAKELGLEIPLSSSGRDIWKKALEFANNGASISEMVKYIEDKNAVKIER
jgi:3-hydroxyisobutyrate dehydrogenase